jgi:hypothetical protein
LTAAIGPLPLPDHGRAGGITYEPVSCGFARYYPTLCHTDIRIGEKEFDPQDGWIEQDAFVVYATLLCGAAGNTPASLEAKVRRRHANGEQTIVEQGMATVLAAGVLAAGTTLIPPGITLADTIGELEQWLYGADTTAPADANYGNVGYLHASPRLAALAMEEDLIVPDGPLLRTRMGTVWSFGGGYPDDGTIYISGSVAVWRSQDVVVPPITQTFNQGTNQNYVLAEREYVVSYDCVVASAIYNWGVPT